MSGTNSNCYLYAGPTLLGTPCGGITPPRGIRLLPPAQRGDIEKLVSYSRPGVIILVDGVFHQYLAVGHAEIREAVAEGWRVWGLSSMGAIRAYEMRNVGVRGYGRVYECFFQHEDFRDDEVALLHEPEPPFRSFSEPLVHIRFWLQEMMETRLISPSQHDQILESLKSMWFGDRTLLRVRGMILDLVPEHVDLVDAMLAQFDRFRVKSLDLVDFVQKQVWKTI